MAGNTMDLLRFATAGSVDDGKSTLIGRLLLDSKAIFEDQLEAVEATSEAKGYDYTDLALLTDGLRSEREQGITIDVAYRYFATPKRKFIIADTPGHVQYTRNMVTGASTADLGLVLVDARQGLTEQSRRHAVILSLLRVPHLVLAVNKMDLVDFSQEVYEKIHAEFTAFATKLNIPDLEVIPISALQGDNVVTRSESMPWYSGPTLMHHLEHVHVASDRDLVDVRFPVQYVVRPKSDEFHDYRGYAGQVAGGVLKPGDEVVVLPSGMTSKIAKIDLFDKEIPEAFPPMSVTVHLEDDVVAGDHRGLRVRQQPLLHRRHRLAVRRVEVEHRGGILARGMDRRMDHEAGAVDGCGRIADRIAVEVDLDQRRGGDLLEHHVVRIDEEMVLRPRHPRREMREDQVVPPVERDEAVGGGEVDAQRPFRPLHLHPAMHGQRSARTIRHAWQRLAERRLDAAGFDP